jgi:hypothetical protein
MPGSASGAMPHTQLDRQVKDRYLRATDAAKDLARARLDQVP